MTRSLEGTVPRWRLLAIALVFVAGLLGPVASAHAGPIPIIPITPVFPPWISGALTASLPATITGVVVNGSGDPVAGALVQVGGDTSSMAPEAQSFSQNATTNASGRYVITDVIQGTYSLTVNSPDETPTLAAYREEYVWQESNGITLDTRHWVQGGHTVDAGTTTLTASGVVNGSAMRGATPVSGAQVTARITEDDIQYFRWTTTGADGSYHITNAPPGNWEVAISGSGSAVPIDATSGNNDTDTSVVTQSGPDTFTLVAGATANRPAEPFQLGQKVVARNWETNADAGTSFNVGQVGVNLAPAGSTDIAYSWITDDTGHSAVYVPPGTWDLTYKDDLVGAYMDLTIPNVVTVSGGSDLDEGRQLTPAFGTFAVWGHLTEAGSPSTNVEAWISASKIDPDSVWPSYVRRVPSNGIGDGHYLIRLPADTGFTGNQYEIVVTERMDGATPSNPVTPIHTNQTFTAHGPGNFPHDVTTPIGGRITGTVHDEAGNPIPGVQVSASRRAYSPALDDMSWIGEDNWFTLTSAAGTYTISGLPTNTDYKVNFSAYYDVGMPLPIHYADYYRRTWRNRPLADSLNSSGTPVTVDHDPVSVTLGATHAGVDETLTPGGYVVLHADGPEYPTGAVYCDVMYQVGSEWVEVDSGFTTGGTFHKDWKVLPTGHYRVDYSDYFGRGGGSWTFDLSAWEHEFGSVLVPAPLSFGGGLTPSPYIGGAFGGTIDGGLPEGGAGGLQLHVQQLASMPATAPARPSNLIPSGGIYDFTQSGASVDGVWTLKLPYNSSVPNSLAGNLRLRHIKADGTAEVLTPFSIDTSTRTFLAQTTSLSPFQVVFSKTRVTLGKPAVPSKVKRNKRFTVSGTLSPRHTAGGKSVQLLVYKWSKKRWKRYGGRVWAKNSNYRSITQYRASLKLGRGSYRIYAYAPDDTWHFATTSQYKLLKIK